MPTEARAIPKRVVYLWGAGATQAEAQGLGAPISLLMRDNDRLGEGITTRILKRMGEDHYSSFGSGNSIDIEKLISLLAASSVDQHTRTAVKMRTSYFRELTDSLVDSGVLKEPHLAIQLLQLHNDPIFLNEVETLSGIITTNHDGLLQVASQQVFEGLNLGFDFQSNAFASRNGGIVPPILQLHGSFTWQFDRPIRVSRFTQSQRSTNTVWIPPTILKESKNYPFNKLSGQAYELLSRQCDVLRIIGSSLTQNDWNILSLIFNSQRHREVTNGNPFLIELIMSHKTGESIKEECAYLKNITPIGFLTEGNFADYKEGDVPYDSDMANPFAYWLNEKYEHHRSRGELSNSVDSNEGLSAIGGKNG